MNSFKTGKASSVVRAKALPRGRRTRKENRIIVSIVRFMIKPPDVIIAFWETKKKELFIFITRAAFSAEKVTGFLFLIFPGT
jgi:hypothetical protein